MGRKNGYQRFGRFRVEDVVPHCGKVRHRFRLPDGGKELSVRMGAQRMILMGRTQECACCGMEGKYFWLEKSGCLPPHFNLYGEDDEGYPVMMTVDHILPRSKGGATTQDNIQLLCRRCNTAKKDDLISLDELRVRLGLVPHSEGQETLTKEECYGSDGEDPCEAGGGVAGREEAPLVPAAGSGVAGHPVGPVVRDGAVVEG